MDWDGLCYEVVGMGVIEIEFVRVFFDLLWCVLKMDVLKCFVFWEVILVLRDVLGVVCVVIIVFFC